MSTFDISSIQNRYSLVPRTLVFIQKEETILFINKNKGSSFGSGKLNGLGGHIEKSEEPFAAARREICEEANIEVNNLELAAILIIDIQISPGIIVFIFKADYLSGKVKKSKEGDLIWISREAIPNNESLVKDVPFLIDLCDKHQAGSPPQILNYIYDDKGELRIVI